MQFFIHKSSHIVYFYWILSLMHILHSLINIFLIFVWLFSPLTARNYITCSQRPVESSLQRLFVSILSSFIHISIPFVSRYAAHLPFGDVRAYLFRKYLLYSLLPRQDLVTHFLFRFRAARGYLDSENGHLCSINRDKSNWITTVFFITCLYQFT